jgi:hypothetical protein
VWSAAAGVAAAVAASKFAHDDATTGVVTFLGVLAGSIIFATVIGRIRRNSADLLSITDRDVVFTILRSEVARSRRFDRPFLVVEVERPGLAASGALWWADELLRSRLKAALRRFDTVLVDRDRHALVILCPEVGASGHDAVEARVRHALDGDEGAIVRLIGFPDEARSIDEILARLEGPGQPQTTPIRDVQVI